LLIIEFEDPPVFDPLFILLVLPIPVPCWPVWFWIVELCCGCCLHMLSILIIFKPPITGQSFDKTWFEIKELRLLQMLTA
jgi:hypothetical protein